LAKYTDQSVYAASFSVYSNCNTQTVCTAQPANFAGIAAVRLAKVTMVFGVDYDSGPNDDIPAGWKLNVHAKSSVPITASGLATHVCLDDGAKLIHVTTCTNQQLNQGDTVNIPRWSVDFKAPI